MAWAVSWVRPTIGLIPHSFDAGGGWHGLGRGNGRVSAHPGATGQTGWRGPVAGGPAADRPAAGPGN
jgi:hypothetical protein